MLRSYVRLARTFAPLPRRGALEIRQRDGNGRVLNTDGRTCQAVAIFCGA